MALARGGQEFRVPIRFPYKMFQWYSRMTRGKTLGARVAVFDAQRRVLLIKASYVPGWNLPGGGVDPGETLMQAAIRELREEAAVEAIGPLQLHGMFSNEKSFRGDHVAMFVCRDFRQNGFKPTREILDARFFAVDKLPNDTRGGARARINEIVRGLPTPEHWSP